MTKDAKGGEATLAEKLTKAIEFIDVLIYRGFRNGEELTKGLLTRETLVAVRAALESSEDRMKAVREQVEKRIEFLEKIETKEPSITNAVIHGGIGELMNALVLLDSPPQPKSGVAIRVYSLTSKGKALLDSTRQEKGTGE